MYILDNIDGFSKMWNLIMWVCFTILWHCFKLFLCLIYQSLSTIVIWKWNIWTPKNLKAKQLASMGNWILVFSLKKKKNESFISCLFFSKKENQENSSAILILNPGLSGSCYLHLFSAGILKFQNDLPKCKSFSSIVAVTYCPLSLLRAMFFNYGNFYTISLVWSPLF